MLGDGLNSPFDLGTPGFESHPIGAEPPIGAQGVSSRIELEGS